MVACLRAPFDEGDGYLERKQYRSAIESFRKFYVENPHSKEAPKALWRIGNIYRLHIKDFNKAAEAYRILVKRFATTEEAKRAQFIIGDVYARQFNDHRQAVVEYQKVVFGRGYAKEQIARAHLLTGNAYYALGNFPQAQIEYHRLIESFGDSEEAKMAKLQLAHSYSAMSNCKQALKMYEEVSRLQPSSEEQETQEGMGDELAVQGKFGAAACLEELGKLDEALTAFAAIADSYPSRRVVEIRMERLEQRMREVSK